MVRGCGSGTSTFTSGAAATPYATPTAQAAGPSESATLVAPAETPTATGAATPTATTSTPAPTQSVSGFYLRAWTVAPIGMENTFRNAPRVISGGKLLAVTYPAASDNPPLYTPPTSRTISTAGLATILAEAQSDGLLGKSATFECPHSPDAGMIAGLGTDHLVLIVGGVSHEMTSSCNYERPTPAPGKPAPATWAAFERFETLLADPAAWLGNALGQATAYTPGTLAVLADIHDPVAESFTPVGVTQWPLAVHLASFGVDVAGARCGLVTGKDAATLLPVVKAAREDAMFHDASGTYADLVVRAFMPGEPNPCVGY
jgi:hypothetical protein